MVRQNGMAVVLISSLTVYVAWNMMELYMGRMLTQIDPEMDSEVELGELLAQMAGLTIKPNADAQQFVSYGKNYAKYEGELKDPLIEKDQSPTRTEMDA